LKPENVLIAASDRSCVKIADFGVAKWLNPEPGSISLTLPGTIVGSLHYMAPEQLTGQQVDIRSDIFSLGVMAFEVLLGRVPFSGTNYAEQVASILQGPEPFQTSFRSAPALQQTIRRCIARDPAERFPSAEALQAVLIPQIREYRPDFEDVKGCA
jgi:serine/threonine-protein kinase